MVIVLQWSISWPRACNESGCLSRPPLPTRGRCPLQTTPLCSYYWPRRPLFIFSLKLLWPSRRGGVLLKTCFLTSCLASTALRLKTFPYIVHWREFSFKGVMMGCIGICVLISGFSYMIHSTGVRSKNMFASLDADDWWYIRPLDHNLWGTYLPKL